MFKYRNTIIVSLAIFATWMMACKARGNHPGREYMPDMAHSRALETYIGTGGFAVGPDGVDSLYRFKHGQTALQPVKGTIPRGYVPYHYPNTPEGYELAGNELRNPFNGQHAQVIGQGKAKYNIYCAPCHGPAGAGDGKISDFVGVWNYFSDPILGLSEGKMFHAVHHGKNLMGSYAPQLTKEERWKIISYIKDLQAKHLAGKLEGVEYEDALSALLNGGYYTPGMHIGKGVSPEMAALGITAADLEGIRFATSELDKISEPLKTGQNIRLNNVFYETGSHALRRASRLELNKLVKILNDNPAVKIEISGHTDSEGDDASNQKLSERRAKEVYNYVRGKGINASRLVFKGYGETKPVASNDTEAGKAQNRRTEFTVL